MRPMKTAKDSRAFFEFYNRLNPKQKEAVDAIDGPVMVIAGPGTGKTQVLTLRIANILRTTDTESGAILALTFSEAGVVAMRKRLAEIIGSAAYYVTISTFHGFCNSIIQRYPEEFPKIVGSTPVTDIDQIRIMEAIILRSNAKILKPFGDPLYYLRSALNSINELKREGIPPESFKKILEEERKQFDSLPDLYHEKGAHKGKMKGVYIERKKELDKNLELVEIFDAYEKTLRTEKFYDWSDMIVEVGRALDANDNLRLMLQEKYHYFLVDEHQDTNNAQNKILELLVNYYENPNLFIVGDEKQAIFRFQGASIENFNYFRSLYPRARLIFLEENYRSTQAILDAAHSLRKESVRLSARAGHESRPITLVECSAPDVEHYFAANDIVRLIKEGVRPEQIAVLYRDNKDAHTLAPFLERAGAPFAIESDENILDDADIRKIALLVQAVAHYGQDEFLAEALHADFLRIAPLDLYKLISYARQNKRKVYDLLKDSEVVDAMGLEAPENITKLHAFLGKARILSKNAGAAEAFEFLVRESGFLEAIMQKPDAAEKISALGSLFDELRELVENHKDFTLRDFADYLDLLKKHNVFIKNSRLSYEYGRVRLMTAHRSKGLEFEYVYILGAVDGHWGNRTKRSHFAMPLSVFGIKPGNGLPESDENEDERNLFYVALTRAKKHVTVSFAMMAASGRANVPSLFLLEIEPELIQKNDVSALEREYVEHKEMHFEKRIKAGPDIKSREFTRELFSRYGLSVTALNNYLECPSKYFYTNLIRLPEAPNKHLMFGTATHAALKSFFDRLREGEDAGADFLVNGFLSALNRQPMESHDFEEAREKGESALRGYWATYHGTWTENVLNEFAVESVEFSPEVRLVGKVDKIEILDAAGSVNVVDYKTGKPKSRNVIQGLTASSDGEYKRQLVFYKLLLDLHGKFKMISGEIDFIEPDDRGKYHKEKFEVTAGEMDELKAIITAVSTEILNLDFWDKICGKKDCKYCALRALMK